MTETLEVGCAIIHKNGKLLIAQRHLGDSFGGYWEFPGGKREQGETIEACLTREAFEELGIRIHPEKLLCNKIHGPNPFQLKHSGTDSPLFKNKGNQCRPSRHSQKENKDLGGTPERKISLFFFFCKWVSGEPRAIDCKDFSWVSREEIRQYTLLPGDLEVLEDLVLHWEEYFKTRGICR
jgi:8-oxo-dGTP pyrophosphatase MutT (NUDIX family)